MAGKGEPKHVLALLAAAMKRQQAKKAGKTKAKQVIPEATLSNRIKRRKKG
jgi:hypothetical protein